MKLLGSFIAGSLILFLVFYWSGLWFEWNLSYSWFDQVLHLVGGFLTAAIFQYFFMRFYMDPVRNRTQTQASAISYGVDVLNRYFWLELIIGLGFVALIGVLWELHEFVADWWIQKPLLQGDVLDTISDLFFDLVGGASFLLLNKILWNLKEKMFGSRFR